MSDIECEDNSFFYVYELGIEETTEPVSIFKHLDKRQMTMTIERRQKRNYFKQKSWS